MRRNIGGKFVKRAMAVSLAATLLLGSAISSFAVEENENDNGYVGTSEYDGKPQSEISSSATDNVKAAQDAASEAESAAKSAADAADSAQKAKDAAEEAVADLEKAVKNADTSAQSAAQLAGESSEYEYTYDENGNVTGYTKKVKVEEESTGTVPGESVTSSGSSEQVPPPPMPEEPVTTPETPESGETGVWQDVSELEDTADQVQKERGRFQTDAEASMEDAANKVDESVKAAQDAENIAKQAAADAANAAATVTEASTAESAVAAQALVDAAAAKAAKAATDADDAYQKALSDYEAAKALYEQYVEDDASFNVAEDARIEALKKVVKDTEIDQEITDVESAKAAYEEALKNVTEALEAANNAAASAQAAATAADEAANRASTKANSVIDMYVAPAKEEANQAAAAVTSKETDIVNLETIKAGQETAYNNIVSDTTNKAAQAYEIELANKKAAYEEAEKAYDKLSWLEKKAAKTQAALFGTGKYAQLQSAEHAYNDYNKESTKNDLIATALRNTTEAKTLAATNALIEQATNELHSLQTISADKAKVLADAQAVRDSYLLSYESALKEKTKEVIIEDLKLQISANVDDINQTEYEKALSEWANDFINGIIHYSDSKDIRAYINGKYNQANWKAFLDKLAILQITTDPNKLIDTVEAAYRITLKQQEEELATVESYIAKLDANVAKGAANDSSLAARAAQVAAAQAASEQKLSAAKERLEEAELTLAKAKASLKKAKEVADSVTVSYVSFDIALKSLQKAEEAVKLAKAVRDKAAEEAKKAQDTKDKLDALVNVIRNDVSDSGSDSSGGGRSANTAYTVATAMPVNAIPVPANESLAGIVQIDPEPVAMAATPVVQGGNPGNNGDVNDNGMTTIEDEETAQADKIEEKAPDTVETADETKTIEDENTALASIAETHSFAWWWILLIVVIMIAAIVGYRYYKIKKSK